MLALMPVSTNGVAYTLTATCTTGGTNALLFVPSLVHVAIASQRWRLQVNMQANATIGLTGLEKLIFSYEIGAVDSLYTKDKQPLKN